MLSLVAVPLLTRGTGGLVVPRYRSYNTAPGEAAHSKITNSFTGTLVAFGNGLMYCTHGGVAMGRYAQT